MLLQDVPHCWLESILQKRKLFLSFLPPKMGPKSETFVTDQEGEDEETELSKATWGHWHHTGKSEDLPYMEHSGGCFHRLPLNN